DVQTLERDAVVHEVDVDKWRDLHMPTPRISRIGVEGETRRLIGPEGNALADRVVDEGVARADSGPSRKSRRAREQTILVLLPIVFKRRLHKPERLQPVGHGTPLSLAPSLVS